MDTNTKLDEINTDDIDELLEKRVTERTEQLRNTILAELVEREKALEDNTAAKMELLDQREKAFDEAAARRLTQLEERERAFQEKISRPVFMACPLKEIEKCGKSDYQDSCANCPSLLEMCKKYKSILEETNLFDDRMQDFVRSILDDCTKPTQYPNWLNVVITDYVNLKRLALLKKVSQRVGHEVSKITELNNLELAELKVILDFDPV